MGIIDRVKKVPYPIPKQFILNLDDIAKLQSATAAYNQIIPALAAHFNIGVVDMNAKLKEMQNFPGIAWDGMTLNTTFVTGGAFSLDGIHLNPRGCALAANYFIDAINKQYNSTIPYVDVTKYPGVIFP
jgi:lysophospholipase L1-like esterase